MTDEARAEMEAEIEALFRRMTPAQRAYMLAYGRQLKKEQENENRRKAFRVIEGGAVRSPEVTPAFAARVQAWRVARDRYDAADERDDATIDPLHDAKQDAYDAMLEEPVQSFGDVLAMARTIKEEDKLGTESACYYEPAFDALLEAVESLAPEGKAAE